MNKTKQSKYVVLVEMKENMITITDYMLLAKKCASIRCEKYYQRNREKIFKKSRLYRENNKDTIKQNRKNIITHTEDIQNFYNQINMLTQMMKSATLIT